MQKYRSKKKERAFVFIQECNGNIGQDELAVAVGCSRSSAYLYIKEWRKNRAGADAEVEVGREPHEAPTSRAPSDENPAYWHVALSLEGLASRAEQLALEARRLRRIIATGK